MRLHDVFGSKLNHTQAVKNAARWATGQAKSRTINLDDQCGPVIVPMIAPIETAATPVESAEPAQEAKTQTPSPGCLNDIFAELISDNSRMGLTG